MKIILTIDDSIDDIEANGITDGFELEYPWILKAEVQQSHCGKCATENCGTQFTASNNASRAILLDDAENIVRIELSGSVSMARTHAELTEGIIKRLRSQAKHQAIA